MVVCGYSFALLSVGDAKLSKADSAYHRWVSGGGSYTKRWCGGGAVIKSGRFIKACQGVEL